LTKYSNLPKITLLGLKINYSFKYYKIITSIIKTYTTKIKTIHQIPNIMELNTKSYYRIPSGIPKEICRIIKNNCYEDNKIEDSVVFPNDEFELVKSQAPPLPQYTATLLQIVKSDTN